MTNEQRTHKQAANQSKTEGPRIVVWVFDQGREIFNLQQARMYAPMVHIEAVYVRGVQMAKECVL